MLFVLRSERAPTRIVRETDDRGVERTFWLWRHGAWLVALSHPDGEISCAHDPALAVHLQRTGGVVVVGVRAQPLAVTLPAPPLDDSPSVSISSVIPVASRVAGLAEFGDLLSDLDGRSKVTGT